MSDRPRKPRGLKAAGTHLWVAMNDSYVFTDEPNKVEILTHACRVTDSIAELERAAAKEPLCVKGSANQLVIHPLRSEIRFQRGLLAQLMTKLDLPDTDEAIVEKAEKLSRTRANAGRSPHLRSVSR